MKMQALIAEYQALYRLQASHGLTAAQYRRLLVLRDIVGGSLL
jgi:hypothetical protein